MWLTTVGLVILVVLLIRAYAKYRQRFWKSRGVPTAPGASLFFGHIGKFMSKKTPRWIYANEVYQKHGGSTFCGYYEFLRPVLMIGDPDLVKTISIKDFSNFMSRRAFKMSYKEGDISEHFLISLTGSRWKEVRSILTPFFTSGRLKGMYPLVNQKADDFIDYILKHTKEDSSVILKDYYKLYTIEVIATCAFGVEAGCFENEDAIFKTMVDGFSKKSLGKAVKLMLFMMATGVCKLFKLSLNDELMSFFSGVIKDTASLRREGFNRGDFLDMMIEAQHNLQSSSGETRCKFEENDISANSVLFIIAGFSTTSATLSFLTFNLAKHPEVQEKLRQEIKDILDEDGNLTYKGIMENNYLESCLSESLRLYPPSAFAERVCSNEYKLPGTEVIIPKDTVVNIPTYSLHHDELYWPEPEKFDPDRFMPENKENIIPGTYLPFHIGPRNCVGMRFAQMEVKLLIAKLLLHFNLEIVPGHEEASFKERSPVIDPSPELKVAFRSLKG